MIKYLRFALALLCLSSSNYALTQQFSNQCELDGRLFYNYCTKYIGECRDNKANGYGELVLNNKDVLRGLFVDNKLQDNFIEYHYSETGKFIIGPNKGARLHGTCMLVSNQSVSLENRENGIWKGNGDYFKISEPKFDLDIKFCDRDFYEMDNGSLIPNTSRIIYLAQRTGTSKCWISVVDLKTNKIVFNYGDLTHPISISGRKPFLEGFSSDGQNAYYDIRVSEKDSPKYVKCNLQNGTKSITNSLPIEISRKKEMISQINSSKYKSFENLKGAEYANKFVLLEDSSYIKIFNSKEFLEKLPWKVQLGPEVSLVRFSRNHEILNNIDFSSSIIYDFEVDEENERFALLYGTNDSTFLSYYDLNNFEKISDVFRQKSRFSYSLETEGNLRFSESGTYLFVRLSPGPAGGTLVYLGNKLFCAITGDLYGLNVEENIAISDYLGTIYAFDLEKKRILWQSGLIGSSNFWVFENKIYFLNINKSYDDLDKSPHQDKSFHRLISVEMPKPLFSVQEFVKIPKEVIVEISNNEISLKNSTIYSNESETAIQYSTEDQRVYRYLEFLNLLAKSQSTNKYSGKTKTGNSRNSNSSNSSNLHCAACGRSFSLQQGWYRRFMSDPYQYGDYTWKAEQILLGEMPSPKYCCKICAME
jgi:hypothetical protein